MNPDSFTGRTDDAIMSTLAHEMAHVWQQGQWNTILRR
jgi:predicted SprT family Zn-dependent metalloprotease